MSKKSRFSDLDFFSKPHVVKSGATSSLITRVPEVKLFGLVQTGILRIDTEEGVSGAH